MIEQILDIFHAADVAFLQEFPYLCTACLLFRTAVLSSGHGIPSER
jgi:hypothetical protein